MQGIISIRLLLLLATVFGALYLLSSIQTILWPFIISVIIAYVLTPVVDILERYRLPRWIGSIILVIVFIALIFGFIALILPMVIAQIQQIITLLPSAFEKTAILLAGYGIDIPNITTVVADIETFLSQRIGQGLQTVAKHFSSILNGAFLVVLVPVIMFYMIRDFHRIPPILLNCVPHKNRLFATEWIESLDSTMSAFFRGQLTVMVALGGLYTLGLMIVGLDNAIAIGVIVGVLSFIPYVGSITGLLLGTLLAVVQFSDPTMVLWVWVVHAVAQTLEGMVLTPNIVGDKVGLNPVWLIFALMAFGVLMGFLGVLLAVPLAALIGTSVKVIFKHYVQSDFYKGR